MGLAASESIFYVDSNAEIRILLAFSIQELQSKKEFVISQKALFFSQLAAMSEIAPIDLKFCAEPTFIIWRWIPDSHG